MIKEYSDIVNKGILVLKKKSQIYTLDFGTVYRRRNMLQS